MAEAERYYVTTPIYYVNDAPHVGHAYTTLACDALARFMRLDGRQVHFLTGTDEHGQKVEKSANAAGMDPKAFTDKVSQNFRDLAKAMNFSNDDFIRTTEERHIKSCQEIWRRLKDRGEIYLGSYAGWYAVRDEAYYGEEELTLTPSGKRLRPALALLTAQLGDAAVPGIIPTAAAIEVLHTATLVHDDLVDNAGVRREFSGRVNGASMEGTVKPDNGPESRWTAARRS